ncbi:MAG: class sortase [Chloroflexi bacterium]|nr:class sortase [Chloroflexota bacterium]
MTTPVPAPPSALAACGRAVALAAAAAVLAGCGGGAGGAVRSPTPSTPQASPAPPLLARPLVPAGLGLHAGPTPVPLELGLPSLQVSGAMLGVGLTAGDAMDAPQGPLGDPVWQQAFWYRGGSIPGDVGTATVAGHVDDVRGRPALFAHLGDLHPGDPVVVHDTRSGTDVRFAVDQVATYSVQQASQPAILASIYGAGPVAGTGPQPAPDGLAHLTLVTCAGGFVHGGYDHRVVVYAQRIA